MKNNSFVNPPLQLIVTTALCSVLLTFGAWIEVILYKAPPALNFAIWLPFNVIFRAHDLTHITMGILQFPIIGMLFVVCQLRFSIRSTLCIFTFTYAAIAIIAYILLTHGWYYHSGERTEIISGQVKPVAG